MWQTLGPHLETLAEFSDCFETSKWPNAQTLDNIFELRLLGFGSKAVDAFDMQVKNFSLNLCCSSSHFYMHIFNHIFVQLGFSASNWQKVPVEYWFIKTQDTNIYTECEGLIKTKWNLELD